MRAIVAMSVNGVIGKDGKMPWGHLPADMKHFNKMTTQDTGIVVMGRKTFESLPNGPLKDRLNIVLTRDENYDAGDAMVMHSVDEILSTHRMYLEEMWVIGGAEIYKQFEPFIDTYYVTVIDGEFEGDTFFEEPERLFASRTIGMQPKDEKHPYDLVFLEMTKL